MVGRWILLIVALHLWNPSEECEEGFWRVNGKCEDYDECKEELPPGSDGKCGKNSICTNTWGSFICSCLEGFNSTTQQTPDTATLNCQDINECQKKDICGAHAKCENTSPYYYCVCKNGFIHSTTGNKIFARAVEPGCTDICKIDKTICGNGTCYQASDGHNCACHAGFTNYGNKSFRCTELKCDGFEDWSNLGEVANELARQLNKSCLELTESEDPAEVDGGGLLKPLLSPPPLLLLQELLYVINKLLSRGALKDKRTVSTFLDLVEKALKLIGPLMTPPGTTDSSNHTDLQLWLHRGPYLPQRPLNLSSTKAHVDMHTETAAGDPASYPGFTAASLLSYANLVDNSLSTMAQEAEKKFMINSRVVTVSVSNTNTSHLEEPVNLTLYHLEETNERNHTCVFWDSSLDGGMWSDSGCRVVESTSAFTVCSCNHLSSFAVLMALHDTEEKFELKLITWVGLPLSLICLFICILTFWLVRSIHSTRTTIHLHLCISLFLANIIFLVGISRTENPVGCAVVAGLLHFFYLAAFFWMCLEGIQLFRMVVLVFNTSVKPLYMMMFGYGGPAAIVAISAAVNPSGYGTERYCWLKLDFIWSFFGPVCVIITINIFFFLITVWKLAQKFTSLNPDLDKLQKIKAFTITAVAQLCVLGIMWIFGCFQFEERTLAMSYLFTIFGSLQGVLLFVMHCLLAKQVREEYQRILSKCSSPKKKKYSEFSSSSSSKPPASKSHDTGESHI